ncbi:AraC family transcriptional regulator [Paenibacillus sp. ClWae2A]|uniref:helix-turn-helix transcriptional regulator n=1 Tax=Paenibacillus sp. ClWae2A TaxID=3057177 RepID=UPI0028F5B133|nr:AraC family transcriptional regulator [Paenibacillus sp. ClWae2A]MDT9717836.1 AraC family transcriptional regulator [Paenibacillus sp. ClWae2A]
MYNPIDLVVRIVWSSRKQTPIDWSDIRNNTSVHTFYWIHEGKGIFHSEDHTYDVHQGMLFYMEPGAEMRMESSQESTLTISMILFDCCTVPYKSSQWQLPQPIHRLEIPFFSRQQLARALRLDQAFNEITESWLLGNNSREMESGALLMKLIALLHRPDHLTETKNTSSIFYRIKEELETRYTEQLYIRDIASKHAISESYLRKIFMNHLGQSPKEFLTEVRLRRSERYLIYTNYTFKRIAIACGYHDEYHFSKAFRKWKGISPSVYRRS